MGENLEPIVVAPDLSAFDGWQVFRTCRQTGVEHECVTAYEVELMLAALERTYTDVPAAVEVMKAGRVVQTGFDSFRMVPDSD